MLFGFSFAMALLRPRVGLANDDPTSSTTATPSRRVVLLPTVMSGEIPDATRREFEAAFGDGLARAGLSFVPASARLREQGCDTPECIRATAAALESDGAVRLRVTASARDYDVVIELFDARTGVAIAKTGERCEVCGVAETRDVIANHAAALRQRLEASEPSPPRLRIHTRPSGAALTIDGQPIGPSPATRVVAPGLHVVRAELPHRTPVERKVQAVENIEEIVALDLPARQPRRPTRLARAGWALLGIGAAGLTAGIVLVAIDGRENRAVCRGDNVDPFGNCRYLHRTKVPGIAVLGTSGALLGVGIGFVAASSARRTRHDGASVTRTGRWRLAILWP